VTVPATGNQDVNSNSIVGFVRNSASAVVAFVYQFNKLRSIGSVINNNNNFSNITVSGTATIAGWVNTDAGNGSKTIQGNTFSNWNAETGIITAMNINTVGTNNTIANNAINTITSAGTIYGITTGTTIFFSNTINS
jgi:hypothetical protein